MTKLEKEINDDKKNINNYHNLINTANNNNDKFMYINEQNKLRRELPKKELALKNIKLNIDQYNGELKIMNQI